MPRGWSHEEQVLEVERLFEELGVDRRWLNRWFINRELGKGRSPAEVVASAFGQRIRNFYLHDGHPTHDGHSGGSQ